MRGARNCTPFRSCATACCLRAHQSVGDTRTRPSSRAGRRDQGPTPCTTQRAVPQSREVDLIGLKLGLKRALLQKVVTGSNCSSFTLQAQVPQLQRRYTPEALHRSVTPPQLHPHPREPARMDQEYDAIVLGTGLKECIISGLLSVSGYKAREPSFQRCAALFCNRVEAGPVSSAGPCPRGRAGAAHRPQQLLWRRVRVAQPHPGARGAAGGLRNGRQTTARADRLGSLRAAVRALPAGPAAPGFAGPQPRVQRGHGAQGGARGSLRDHSDRARRLPAPVAWPLPVHTLHSWSSLVQCTREPWA